MRKFRKSLEKFILCKIFNEHKWTSKSLIGIKPTKEELDSGYEGFKEYSKMYCSRCLKESKLNN